MHPRMKLVSAATVVLLVPIMALAACTGTDDQEPGDPGDPGDVTEDQPGFETCNDEPNTCNSGERAEGGTITWLIPSGVDAWNTYSPEGGTVYGIQLLYGIYPNIGNYLPDRFTYEFNMDLFAEEPVSLSDDPQSWQYVIRDEAVWDDGTPIDVDDFIVSWKLGTSEGEGHCLGCRSRAPASFDQIDRIEGSADGKTVTVTLKEGQANPEWFTMFNTDHVGGGLMPAHVAGENGLDIDDPEELGEYFEWLQETMPTYSGGPYRIVEGDLESQVIKEPNPQWYGEVRPTLDTIVIRILTDQGGWVPALANDELHGGILVQLNEDVIRGVEDMPNVYGHIQPGPSWEHIDLNLDVPEFGDVALRRAIFTAIDVDNIASRNFGELFPEYTPRTNHAFDVTSPHHVDYLTPTGQGSGDTDAALAILDEAGYDFDGDTLTLDGEQIGPFRLRSTSDLTRATSMELVQADLAEIGIETNIEPTDQLGAMMGGQDYDIAQFGWSGPPADFFGNATQQWATDGPSNFGNYSNPEMDRLSEMELAETDQDAAAEIVNQMVEVVVEDAYVLPLYDVPVFAFVADDYVNIRDNTGGSVRALYNHHEWGTAIQ